MNKNSCLKLSDKPIDKMVAIIGMAGCFPGANDLDTFWHNLCNGVESVNYFTNEELRLSGISQEIIEHPDYVKSGMVLSDVAGFDADFFNILPAEALVMDPQQRLLLECAWTALEHAGYIVNDGKPTSVGVYAGINVNSYYYNLPFHNCKTWLNLDSFNAQILNDKEYCTTFISHALNLSGPSVNVQTACSTSLVAVHLACLSILNEECEMSLAGGCYINPRSKGYMYHKGSILSSDGHIRSFDENASGTVMGNGLALVVLKRLDKALFDGDTIHAVIRGSAINNDGSLKPSYTTGSIEGQSVAITMAQAAAGIDIETISYIEAHATGTRSGDPVEIAALTHAFRRITDRKNFCPIGALKPNIGHLGHGSGAAALIKLALCFKNGLIPASINCTTPNLKLDIDNSPFYINTTLQEWETPNGTPRRAGLNSFGVGGTNVHMIVEEAPLNSNSGLSRPWQLLILSAQTPSALEVMTSNLAVYLEAHPDVKLADVAYTLGVGRKAFKYRRVLICENSPAKATNYLRDSNPQYVFTGEIELLDKIGEKQMADLWLEEYLSMEINCLNSTPAITLLRSIGQFWLVGGKVDWHNFYADEKRQRIPLPTYPFEHKRYWLDSPNYEFAKGELHFQQQRKKLKSPQTEGLILNERK